MYNTERMLLRLVRAICLEQNISCTVLEQDWLLLLQKGKKTARILGYQFDLNPSASMLIASDKSATYSVLRHHNVAAVAHQVFLHPKKAKYLAQYSNWHAMQQYLAQHGALVCKPNKGTGGQDVHQVANISQLEQAVHDIYSQNQDVCLSPFLPIDSEHRLVMLDGECLLCYQKIRPEAVGDGIHTLQELAAQKHLNPSLCSPVQPWQYIPQAGETVALEWRHNLGKGAKADIVQASPEQVNMAAHAVQALGLRFCSVDIASIRGTLYVLEVNSGVMMEHYAREGEAQQAHAKAIYARAIQAMLEM